MLCRRSYPKPRGEQDQPTWKWRIWSARPVPSRIWCWSCPCTGASCLPSTTWERPSSFPRWATGAPDTPPTSTGPFSSGRSWPFRQAIRECLDTNRVGCMRCPTTAPSSTIHLCAARSGNTTTPSSGHRAQKRWMTTVLAQIAQLIGAMGIQGFKKTEVALLKPNMTFFGQSLGTFYAP